MSTPKTLSTLSLLALALLVAVACGSPDGGGEAELETESQSVLVAVPDDPTVSFAVWFDAGSQDDPVGKEGLAALTGSLIAEGSTTENSYQEILEKLYPLASSYEVRVDKEMTTLTGRTHEDNLEEFYALFTDAYLAPAFQEEDFQRLKADQLNYLTKTLRYASDEELGKAALVSAVFDGTRYEHPAAGTVAGLESITVDDVRSFYRKHYTRANAVVGLGGGYPNDLAQRFEATLGELPEGTPPPMPPPEPAPIEGRQVLLVSKPNADASISFGHPVDVRRGERDFYALWIANSWLGEHRNSSSHLYEVIREKRGLNYGDYSYIEAFPEGGRRQMPPPNVGRSQQMFEVWIRTLPNEQALFALRAAIREIDRLIEEGMSEEELELTRSFLGKYHLHFAETTQERLGYAIDDRFYGVDGEGHLARFGEMLESITREEVNAAIEKHLSTDDLAIAIVTGDAGGLREKMVSDEPTPIEYASEKEPEILEEDEEIASYPLGIAEDAVTIVPVDDLFEQLEEVPEE